MLRILSRLIVFQFWNHFCPCICTDVAHKVPHHHLLDAIVTFARNTKTFKYLENWVFSFSSTFLPSHLPLQVWERKRPIKTFCSLSISGVEMLILKGILGTSRRCEIILIKAIFVGPVSLHIAIYVYHIGIYWYLSNCMYTMYFFSAGLLAGLALLACKV